MAIFSVMDDFDLRFHHRSQMESAGLQKIIELCKRFGVTTIDTQIGKIEKLFKEDEATLRERLDQGILRDLANPQDVFNAIHAKTDGTRARGYFLSMMQHLLLIREEGQAMVHYYRLLDSIVTDVVLDNKLGGAEQRMGRSVNRIIAQFNDADRYQEMEDEAARAHALAVQLKLEKEKLEDEISQGHDGLVGNLKLDIASLEEKLSVSRETTSRLHSQIADQRHSYEHKIIQLEAQIMELFRMLKEVGKDVETILDGGAMDRKTLVQTLERNFQRHRTISILEGKEGPNRRKRQKAVEGVNASDSDDDDDIEATPGKSSLRKLNKRGLKPHSDAKIVDDSGRVSQFMDADEADALEQVQQQLAAGAKLVSHNVYVPGDAVFY
jgi:cytokinesis protein